MFKRSVLVVLLTLTVCAPAYAGHWTDRDVSTAILVADAHWPGSRCAGREVLLWRLGVQLAVGDGHLADALPGTCTVEVAWDDVARTAGPDRTAALLCTVLEHEFGHLAGYYNPIGVVLQDGTVDHTHSPNHRDVMFPATVVPSHECRAALPIPARRLRWIGERRRYG